MKINRGRWVAAIAGGGVLLVAGLLALEWREILVRYHIWRLDRAQTEAEAQPWLEALAKDSRRSGMAESILRRLGPKHQNFTFWCFCRLCPVRAYNSPRFSTNAQEFFPLIHEAVRRMESDESLLTLWAHFLRWRKTRLIMDSMVVPPDIVPIFELAEQTRFEQGFLEFLGALWVLNVGERPSCPTIDPDMARTMAMAMGYEQRWNQWVKVRRESFRFDPQQGRFLPAEAGDELTVPISAPATPLPGWSGPIPAREGDWTNDLVPVYR